jgi:hypothetical protein
MKSTRLKSLDNISQGGMRNTCKNAVQNPKLTDHLPDPSVDGKMILKWMLRIYGVRMWIGFMWLRIEINST